MVSARTKTAHYAKRNRTQQLHDQGFDLSENIRFTKEFRVRCSQCQAAVINGVPCHENGCPNQVRDDPEEE